MRQRALAGSPPGAGRLAPRSASRRRVPRWSGFAAIWLALAVLLAISPLLAPGSLGYTALAGMLPFAAATAIAAVGESFVIRQGGLDLSVAGGISLASAILTRYCQTHNDRLAIALLLVLLAAVAAGLINGVATTVLRINPFVATLAANALMLGTVQAISGGVPTASPATWSRITLDKTGGIPNTAIIGAVVVAIVAFAMSATVVGRRAVAIGANPRAARAAGLAVQRYQIGSHVAASVCYALAGVLLAGFLQTPTLTVGNDYLLPAIAAVVLGGSSLVGGRGSLLATAGGALFLSQLNQVVLAMGASTAAQYLIQALIIGVGISLRYVGAARLLRRRAARISSRRTSSPSVSGRTSAHDQHTTHTATP
jgi:ribose transport system permease protein